MLYTGCMTQKSSVRRLVENEAVFRSHNENVQQGLKKLNDIASSEGYSATNTDGLSLQLYCECSDENCTLRIPLKIDAYGDIHKNRQHFVVIPGHEFNSIEKVVIKKPAYYVVEKFAEAPENPHKLNKTKVTNV